MPPAARNVAATLVAFTVALVIALVATADEPTATTAATVPPPVAFWSSAEEVVLGPVVVTVESVSLDGSVAEIGYAITPIAPGSDTPALFPDRWTLITRSGEITVAGDPQLRRIQVGLPAGTERDDLVALRIDRAWLVSPFELGWDVAQDDASIHEVLPGLSATVLRVQPQANGAVVIAEVSWDEGPTSGGVAIDGRGPGWTSASSNFGNSRRWTMTFVGDPVPDPLPLRVRGVFWTPIATEGTLDLSGAPGA